MLQPLAPSAEWLANDYCSCVEGTPCDVPIDAQCTGWRSISVGHCNNCPVGLIHHVCPSRQSPAQSFTAAEVACDSECAHVIADTVEACEITHDGMDGGGVDALKPVLHAVAAQCSALVEARKCHEAANDQAQEFNAACCGGEACANVFLPDACGSRIASSLLTIALLTDCCHTYRQPGVRIDLHALLQQMWQDCLRGPTRHIPSPGGF